MPKSLPVFSVPSISAYVTALSRIRNRLSESQMSLLRIWLATPHQRITSQDLAKKLGYRSHGGATLQYGRLAKLLCRELGLLPKYWILGFAKDFGRDKRKGLILKMRAEPYEALKRLDWFATKQPRYFTAYWKNETCKWQESAKPERLDLTGSNGFKAAGIGRDDFLYVFTVKQGSLFLIGRMQVTEVISRKEAIRRSQNDNLLDSKYWCQSSRKKCTNENFDLRVPLQLVRRLEFVATKGTKPVVFERRNARMVHRQSMRSVRQLTVRSAALLDKLLGVGSVSLSGEFRLAEEVFNNGSYVEGATQQVVVNAYERSESARRACIRVHGKRCAVCYHTLEEFYGPLARGIIHVHHIRPLSSLRRKHKIDPVKDLRPVCPNCHAVIHARNPCLTIRELRRVLDPRTSNVK